MARERKLDCSVGDEERFMSGHKQDQKQQSSQKEQMDKEGMAQGADTADVSSLKKEIDSEGQKPNQQKKAS